MLGLDARNAAGERFSSDHHRYRPSFSLINLNLRTSPQSKAATHQVGSNTVITDPHNSADTITLTGVSLSSLHFDASHFLLA